jgi:GTPase SAR1 family protein
LGMVPLPPAYFVWLAGILSSYCRHCCRDRSVRCHPSCGAIGRSIEVSSIDLRGPDQIERAISEFAREPNGGLIVTAAASAITNRELIISLAARYKLPAVSYAADFTDQYRRAASYVDRILRGEKPADLPVQAPTRYELVINLKAAKALGLDVPATLFARADEVIE